MAKNTAAQRPTGRDGARPQGAQAEQPRVQGRLGLVAVVLAVLALPAALFPWLGLIISVVVLAVALVALIVAVRSPRLSRGYPMAAVAVAIVAVALSGVVTSSTAQTLQDCSSNDADEVRACMENRGED